MLNYLVNDIDSVCFKSSYALHIRTRQSSFVVYCCTMCYVQYACTYYIIHNDLMKWKHFPRYWPFVRGIHWSPVNSPHKDQWRGAYVFFFIWAWTNGWVNDRDDGYLRRRRADYDVTVMIRYVYISNILQCCLTVVFNRVNDMPRAKAHYFATYINYCISTHFFPYRWVCIAA